MIKALKVSAIFLFFLGLNAVAQTQTKVYFDQENWTEYIEGNMPLVISVPHAGSTLAKNLPLRGCKGAVTVTDGNTMELAREIQKAFEQKYQLTPHIVICHLSRKNVDQNRAMDEGTCGNAMMEKPWKQFHNYIDTALAIAVKKYGNAMYIDLHGHGHPNQRLELGYIFKKEHLMDLENTLKTDSLAYTSSLNNLLNDKKLDLKNLLIGDMAFGTLMANRGIPAVPSKQDKAPKDDEKFFAGGYNTVRYTSSVYPKVFGFQIETNYKGVRDPAGRPLFATAFANSVVDYLKETLGIDFYK
jgi:hypothetical protein